MRIVARTDKGMVRDNNQDSYTAGELSGGTAYAIVCDGMGGAAGGAFASSAAVKIIREKICNGYQQGMSDLSVKALLVSALEKANKYIHDVSLTDEAYFGMGTTAVAAIITEDFAYIAHAGDSRAYKLSGGKAYQLTHDHSVVQRMLDRGQITEDEALEHPKKHIITRAIGVDDFVQIDFCQEDFYDDDILVFCTDGLTNYVKTDDLTNLTNDGQYQNFAGRLVDLANENGGGDNITVVAVTK